MNNSNIPIIKKTQTAFHLNFSIIVFLLLPLFKPGSLAGLAPIVESLFDIWVVVDCMVVLFLFLLSGKLSKLMLAIIAFEMVQAFTTFFNGGNVFLITKNIIKVIICSFLIEYTIKNSPKELVRAILFVLGIECAINSATILIFPNGMYKTVEQFTQYISWTQTQNFFFGYDNTHILYILPLLCVFLIYANHRNFKRRLKILVIFFFTATVYVTWSAASVVSITIFLVIFLMSEFHLNLNLFKFKYYFILITIAFFTVIIFRLQRYFSGFIVGFLGKDLSLTGRTLIWDRTLQLFLEHPVLGFGRSTRVETFLMIGAPHPHNLFLRILYESGIIGMISFLVIILLVGKSLRATLKNKDCFVMSLTVFCFLLIFLVESFDDLSSFFAMLTMACHINLLTEGLNRPEIRKSTRRFVLIRKGNKYSK